MKLRKTIFWIHLSAGVVAGSIVLLMSITGVLLTYERQVEAWANRSLRATELAPGVVPPPLEALLERVRSESPEAEPSSLTVLSDPAEPVVVGLGRGENLYVDRATGAPLGEGSPRVRRVFRTVTDWHRWLGRSGEGRSVGRAVTGACNLAFLFLVVSGVYLWFPRSWKPRTLRAQLWFRSELRGKARDFNWHNVIGFWSAVPLFVIVSSGVVISYPWASDLVYRMTGSEPPARTGRGAEGSKTGSAGSPPSTASLWHGLDELVPLAAAQSPDWRSITVRRPESPDAPFVFAIDRGTGGQPAKRSTLTVDRATCEVVSHETFAEAELGRRVRSWLRFAHTGEVYGVVGQTLAGLASAGAAFLVWTGLALTWRRLLGSLRSTL